MTIPSVVTSGSGENDNGVTSNDFTFDAGSTGSGRLLVVVVYWEDNATRAVSSVSYNSVALTQQATYSIGPDNGLEFWTLASPATGSNTLNITFNEDVTDIIHNAVVLQDVNATPVGNVSSQTSGASSLGDNTHSFTTANADSLILTAAVHDQGGTTGALGAASSDTTVVEAHLDATETGSATRGFSTITVRQDAATATSYTTGFNVAANAGDNYTLRSIEIRGVAGGGGGGGGGNDGALPLINGGLIG